MLDFRKESLDVGGVCPHIQFIYWWNKIYLLSVFFARKADKGRQVARERAEIRIFKWIVEIRLKTSD